MTSVRTATAGGTRLRLALTSDLPSGELAALARSTPFLAAILFVLTMPIVPILPTIGPDPSWQAGLYMALEGGLHFGRDFVFTYGPLGFLHVPALYGEGLFLLSLGFTICVRYVLAVSLLWTARRALPLPFALVACYVILVVGHLNSALVLVVFLWAFAAIAAEPPRQSGSLLAIGGGFLAAVELLGKFNYGLSILILCLIALPVVPRRTRNLPVFAVTFLTSILALWLVTGQVLADLPSYLSDSIQIVAGYSRAMGIDIDLQPHALIVALVAIACLILATVLLTRRERTILRIATLLLIAAFAFACFKQDFVRGVSGGGADFSLMMAAAALALATRLSTPSRIARGAIAAAVVSPALALVVWSNPAPSIVTALDPQVHLQSMREDLRMVADPAVRRSERVASARGMQAVYAVPPRMLHQIGGRSVAIEPWEIGVAWAYGLDWKPLPVIQDYSAYTPALDRLNAAALRTEGPRMILRRDLRGNESGVIDTVDGRYPAWDSPAAKLALLCNYREVGVGDEWQLLEKTANRCGTVHSLDIVRTTMGSPISLPRVRSSDEIVFARIHGLEPDLGESIETLAYRAPGGWVSFADGERWTLDTATAADGLILSAPANVDYSRPFQLAPDPRSFSVGIDGAGPRPITVSFYSQKVEPRRATGKPRAADSDN